MSSSVNADLVEKVRKILARTEDKGCTTAEAEQAYKLASRLMAEHNISMADVEVSGEDEWGESPILFEGARLNVEVDYAVQIACNYFFVKALLSPSWKNGKRGKKLMFFGKTENVAIASHIFTSMRNAFDRLWTDYRSRTGSPAADRRLYVEGIYDGFSGKLAAERRAMNVDRDLATGESGGTALALRNIEKATIAKLEEIHQGKIKKMRQPDFAVAFGSNETYEDGKAAGQSLNLDRPVEEKSGRKSIGD
jgi:hypothetical protein